MKESTKRLARLSLLTALGVGFLCLASVLPSAQLAVIALAGFTSAVALMMYSAPWAAAVYAVTAVLSLLIVPEKGCAILFDAFFGYYPILKSYFERLHDRRLGWITKLALYTAAFFLLWFIGTELFLGSAELLPWYILWPLGGIAFVIYDICLSFLIRIYIEKISGYIK